MNIEHMPVVTSKQPENTTSKNCERVWPEVTTGICSMFI